MVSRSEHTFAHLDRKITLESIQIHDKYEELKEEFYRDISPYYKPIGRWKKWTTEMVRNKINAISVQPRPSTLTHTIIIENGKEILINRRRNANSPLKRILVFDETFDVILQIFLEKNYSKHETIKDFIEKYVVPKTVVTVFFSLHLESLGLNVFHQDFEKVMKKESKRKLSDALNTKAVMNKDNKHKLSVALNTTAFNETVFIGFIDLSPKLDEGFKYVLVYTEYITKHTLLRPMISWISNEYTELSNELFKIFLDFGIPKNIITLEGKQINGVLQYLQNFWPTLNINYSFLEDVSIFTSLLSLIYNEIIEWMQIHDCTNWAIGCRLIQFKYNCEDSQETPFEKIFTVLNRHKDELGNRSILEKASFKSKQDDVSDAETVENDNDEWYVSQEGSENNIKRFEEDVVIIEDSDSDGPSNICHV